MFKIELIKAVACCMVVAASAAVTLAVVEHQSQPTRKTTRATDPAQNGAGKKKEPPSQAEISNLVEQLGDRSFKIRELATKKLGDIAVPALDSLQKAAQRAPDLETRQRALQLVNAIRRANGLPPITNGLEFKLTIDESTTQIRSNAPIRLKCALHITNVALETCLFDARGSTSAVIKNASAKSVLSQPAVIQAIADSRPKSAKENQFLTLKQGANLVMDFELLLMPFADGSMSLLRPDGTYYSSPAPQLIPRGSYSLQLTHENLVPADRRTGEPVWKGTATTLECSFKVF